MCRSVRNEKETLHSDSPAFETAATRSGVDIHDIPGRTIGYLHPKREVILVRTAGAAAIVRFRFACVLQRFTLYRVESSLHSEAATRTGGEGRRLGGGKGGDRWTDRWPALVRRGVSKTPELERCILFLFCFLSSLCRSHNNNRFSLREGGNDDRQT